MFILYDLIFLIAALIYLPVYLFKKKFRKGFFFRLGFLPKGLALGRPVWIHAVSVGEAMVIKGLAAELRKAYPEKKLVISTVTPTGNKIAKAIAKEGDLVTYLPLDLSFLIKKVIDKINPSIFIIAETEIWPNLINCLSRRQIPIVTVNGRLSDDSFKGYLRIRFFLKRILNKISLFCVQSERDAQRFVVLGVSGAKVKVTGNMKFDASLLKLERSELEKGRKDLGLAAQDKLLACGSTHPGEEELILGVYKKLLINFPNLKLLLAPRHPERSKDLGKIISGFGFRSVFISSPDLACSGCLAKPVFVLDIMGELISYYETADIVFVGGSLVKKGGHNILEPASFAKPIIFGPNMANFRDIADLFLEHKAAILVNGEEELQKNIADLLNNPAKKAELGRRAKELIQQNQGATGRNALLIQKIVF